MKKLWIVAMVLVLLLSILPVANAEKYVVTTIDEPLNVREEPRGNVIGIVYKGQTIEVLSTSSEWAKIKFGDTTAYVYKIYIASTDTAEKATKKKGYDIYVLHGVDPSKIVEDATLCQVTVSSGTLNVRYGPSRQDNIKVRLSNHAYVWVLKDMDNGWVKVRYNDAGRTGYVKTEFLELVGD